MTRTKFNEQQRREHWKKLKQGTVAGGPTGQDVSKARLAWVAPVAGGVKPVAKAKRYRPGTLALREIRKYTQSTELLLKKEPFWKLVRSRGLLFRTGLRYQKSAMEVLQEITEAYLVTVLEDAQVLATYRGKKGLQPRDIMIVFRMRHQTAPEWKVPAVPKRVKKA
jgi:histone H3